MRKFKSIAALMSMLGVLLCMGVLSIDTYVADVDEEQMDTILDDYFTLREYFVYR